MGVSVFWDNPEKTILRQIYRTSNNAPDDYYDAIGKAAALMEHVEHEVDAIIEFQDDEPHVLLHMNFNALENLRGKTGGRYRLVDSLDEAYAVIHRRRGEHN